MLPKAKMAMIQWWRGRSTAGVKLVDFGRLLRCSRRISVRDMCLGTGTSGRLGQGDKLRIEILQWTAGSCLAGMSIQLPGIGWPPPMTDPPCRAVDFRPVSAAPR